MLESERLKHLKLHAGQHLNMVTSKAEEMKETIESQAEELNNLKKRLKESNQSNEELRAKLEKYQKKKEKRSVPHPSPAAEERKEAPKSR